MCDKNYSFFLANIEELCEKYHQKYVAIKNEAIIGIYDTFDEAYDKTIATEELGTFLIQQCVKEDASINFFYSNNVVFA